MKILAPAFARRLLTQIDELPEQKAAPIRALRMAASKQLKDRAPAFVMQVADEMLASGKHRWVAYELIRHHPAAFAGLDESLVEKLGQGMDSWWTVDAFGSTISGPAWLAGMVGDDLIERWARSADLWWRRAALVSTTPLNVRAKGGHGDTRRTLAICRLLVADKEDMVIKALSWALRALSVHDPSAVKAFLAQFDEILAARVKREVNNKLRTGLKNPRRSRAP